MFLSNLKGRQRQPFVTLEVRVPVYFYSLGYSTQIPMLAAAA
jgi:hypothetical protein